MKTNLISKEREAENEALLMQILQNAHQFFKRLEAQKAAEEARRAVRPAKAS